ncbi:hypothetical protein JAAARDRAFT_200487 [Jaapia argillacea MUCL 33604]|uniref:Uncharacterized protein n=1 Tax=Jaapia argillacea MUCL 33604 TaxID=933084 RepID=A0A067P7N5_9AGAM|nr:hypothetical protein JAAARDRAFT_200487 [Jaapia argillacea MUCL 33604]
MPPLVTTYSGTDLYRHRCNSESKIGVLGLRGQLTPARQSSTIKMKKRETGETDGEEVLNTKGGKGAKLTDTGALALSTDRNQAPHRQEIIARQLAGSALTYNLRPQLLLHLKPGILASPRIQIGISRHIGLHS